MVSIKNLFFLITAASALVIDRRDAAQIQSDLNQINTDTRSLKSAADKFSGGLFGAIPVQEAAKTLENDLDSATTNANNSAAISDSEASSIISYISNTLTPSIEAALTSVENKKSQFTSAGLKGTVQDTLSTLRSNTNTYGNALLEKAPASAQDSGNAALTKIDNDFASAQAFYAN